MENDRKHPGGHRRNSILRKFWGGSNQSFGRKSAKFGRWRNTAIVFAVIFAAIGIVVFLSTYEIGRDGRENTAVSLFDGDSFDPIRDFVAVRDNGTVDQLERLLLALKDRSQSNEAVAVKLDYINRTLEIADLILGHADQTEQQRVLAAKAKLNAIWNASRINTQFGFDNSATFEQLSSATSQFMVDSNSSVSRDAHIFQTMGLIMESARNRFSGNIDSILNSLADLLKKFPDDAFVLNSLRSVFPGVRAANSEQSMKLADQILEEVDRSDSPKSRELSRFMKDILLLHEAGIGNDSKIDSITVNDEDFLQRLDQLNSNLDGGETLVFQLDNAIDYFERRRQFDKALELSQKVLDRSASRTDFAGAELAKTIGENGVARNSLIQNRWSFDEMDARGVPIDASRYSGQVTLIAFYDQQDPRSAAFLNAVQSLTNVLVGRDVQFLFVKIDAGSNTVTSDTAGENRWPTLKTSLTAPNGFLRRCPTKRFPYLVLIDKNGNVDSINVPLIEAKTGIEYLLSKE